MFNKKVKFLFGIKVQKVHHSWSQSSEKGIKRGFQNRSSRMFKELAPSGGSTGLGYGLLRFHCQEELFNWQKQPLFHQ